MANFSGNILVRQTLNFLGISGTPTTPGAGTSKVWVGTDGRLKWLGDDGRVRLVATGVESLTPWFQAGRWTFYPNSGGVNTNTMSQNRAVLTPLVLDTPVNISQFMINLTTAAGAGATLKAAIYNNNYTTMKPSTLFQDLGTSPSAATTTGDKSWTPGTAVAFTPGVWWLAVVTQGSATAGVIRGIATQHPLINSSASQNMGTLFGAYNMTAVSGAWPGSFTENLPDTAIRWQLLAA